MLTFTLDWNCIIALEQREPPARSVEFLVQAHRASQANLALVAASASERQIGGKPYNDFADFKGRIAGIGLASLEILLPIMIFDVSYWDNCVWGEPDTIALERSIHEVLFPNIAYEWPDYCKQNGVSINAVRTDRRWLNAKCDVQGYWCHAHANRDVFVTSDKNFHQPSKKQRLIAIGGRRIEFPHDAAALI